MKKKEDAKDKEDRKKQRSQKLKEKAKEWAESLKDETKKSSNLSLFTKIETLSNRSGNLLVKAELEDILGILKIVL